MGKQGFLVAGATVLNLCLAAFIGSSLWLRPAEADPAVASAEPPSETTPEPSVSEPPPLVESVVEPEDAGQRGARLRLPRFRLPMKPAALEAEARMAAEILLRKLPEDPRSLHVAAVCRAQLRETKEAEKLWLRCIELDPRGEPYYMNLAANFLNRGDSQDALDILEKARDNGLGSPDISHHTALALTNLGRDTEAVEELKKFLETDANQGPHWLLLGQTQLKLREPQEAKESLLKAESLGVLSKPLYTALMNTSIQLADRDSAAKYRDQLKQFDVAHPVAGQERYVAASEGEARRTLISVLQEAGAVYQNEQMWLETEAIYLRLIALDPTNMGPYQALATGYQSQSLFIDEFEVREKILEREPQNFMNYLLAAKAASNGGLVDKAEGYLKLAISISPLVGLGHAAMGEFLLEQNRPEEAIFHLNDALMLEASPGGFRLMARALRGVGKEQEAQAATARAMELEQQ